MEKNSSGKVLKDLIMAFEKNMENFDNDTIEATKMYGVFLKNNNFIICKEIQINKSGDAILEEFFTNQLIESNKETPSEIIYPWRKQGLHFCAIFNELMFFVPIKELLGKFSIKEFASEKDVVCLYKNVTKYIKENPNFVDQLFNNKKEKTR